MRQFCSKLALTFFGLANLIFYVYCQVPPKETASSLLNGYRQNPKNENPLNFNKKFYHYSSGQLNQNLKDFKSHYNYSTDTINKQGDFSNDKGLKFTNETIKFADFNDLVDSILNDPQYTPSGNNCFAGIRTWVGMDSNAQNKLILFYEPVILKKQQNENKFFYDILPLSRNDTKYYYIKTSQKGLTPISKKNAADNYIKKYQSQYSNLYIQHVYKNSTYSYKFIDYKKLENPSASPHDIIKKIRPEQFYGGDLQYDVLPLQQLLELHINNRDSDSVSFTLGASQSRFIHGHKICKKKRNFKLHIIFHVLTINEKIANKKTSANKDYVIQNADSNDKKANDSTEGPPSGTEKLDVIYLGNVIKK